VPTNYNEYLTSTGDNLKYAKYAPTVAAVFVFTSAIIVILSPLSLIKSVIFISSKSLFVLLPVPADRFKCSGRNLQYFVVKFWSFKQ